MKGILFIIGFLLFSIQLQCSDAFDQALLTKKAQDYLNSAFSLARGQKHSEVHALHLAKSIFSDPEGQFSFSFVSDHWVTEFLDFLKKKKNLKMLNFDLNANSIYFKLHYKIDFIDEIYSNFQLSSHMFENSKKKIFEISMKSNEWTRIWIFLIDFKLIFNFIFWFQNRFFILQLFLNTNINK